MKKCIAALDKELQVPMLQYTVVQGTQAEHVEADTLKRGESFDIKETRIDKHRASVASIVRYDLVGKLAEATVLTRATIAEILRSIAKPVFGQFSRNPEGFLSEAARLIREQKASAVVERLTYDLLEETWNTDIFTLAQSKADLSKCGSLLNNHIYDYAITDSAVERRFVQELDTSAEVVVYAKLPRGFSIPTPVGDYNPDWAIAFKEGTVKHVYFVAETKGSMSSMELRAIEQSRIECARKFFGDINRRISPESIRYDVVDSFERLRDLVA